MRYTVAIPNRYDHKYMTKSHAIRKYTYRSSHANKKTERHQYRFNKEDQETKPIKGGKRQNKRKLVTKTLNRKIING